jgi:hypothetical protein
MKEHAQAAVPKAKPAAEPKPAPVKKTIEKKVLYIYYIYIYIHIYIYIIALLSVLLWLYSPLTQDAYTTDAHAINAT